MKIVSARQQDETDLELLQAFLASGSDQAFEALVRKYLGMVLGIAARKTGNQQLAEEIAQNVFGILARKAKGLAGRSSLAGWIYRVTVIECAEAMRREISHQNKMQAAGERLQADREGREVWQDALPILDEGIAALPRKDGEILLLRFFEGKNFREIGAALGKSDDAAQKQTERALEKLSLFLKRKGVAISATAIGPCLAAQWAQPASAALAHTIAQASVATVSVWSAKILILKTLITMSSAKSKAAVVVAVLLAIPLAIQWRENARLRKVVERTKPAAEAVAPSDQTGFATRPAPLATGLEAALAQSTIPDGAGLSREWELALLTPDPIERSQRISQLLAGLTAESAPLIVRAFETAESAGLRFDEEQRLFLRAWGRLGGVAAVEYAIKRWGRNDSFESTAALAGWASVDPLQARQWLAGLPESDGKEQLVYGLLDGWSTLNFQAAAAFAETRPHSPARDSFRELLGQRALRAGGIAAAQNWVAGIPNEGANADYKGRAFDDVIQAMLYRDPSAAASWISQQSDLSYVRGETIARTASKLAENSPINALNWMESISGGAKDSANRAAGKIVRNWAKSDVTAAGAWLGGNPQNPWYDAMAENYAYAIRKIDPAAADAWAQTIQDEAGRERALAGVDPSKPREYKLAFNVTGKLNEAIDVGEGLMTFTKPDAQAGPGRSTTTISLDAQPNLGTAQSEIRIKGNPHGTQFAAQDCSRCHAQ